MSTRPPFTRALIHSARVSVIAAAGILLGACSSGDSSPGSDGESDPAATAPGEAPIIMVPVVELEPEEFAPPATVTASLYDTLVASGSFTRLLALFDKAGLSDMLENEEGVLTLFAPDDDAFAELDSAIGQGVLSTFSVAELEDRLLYHVVPDVALDTTALRSFEGQAIVTGNDLPAAISVDADGALLINHAAILSGDMLASNGILHVISSVLTPPLRITDPNDNIPPPTTTDIATQLLEQSDYSTLLLLIEQAGMIELLQQDNDGQGWTLFAPSDGAFAVGEQDVFELDAAGAEKLVRLHLYSGELSTAQMQDGELTMSEGSVEIARDAETGLTVGGARIVGRDREVGNGIIHYVDKPLTPVGN